ncbi:RSP_7527 family protein [Plastorhodobacter daqingensis]|uniref:RSP_7527 family protein n=1 Tax=Plastorhodobacter daqingensis TaxID=1387281 RepID=A0ABW2ULJ4_9RHOB
MTEMNKTTDADVICFAAIERRARELRAEATRETARAIAAWFSRRFAGLRGTRSQAA